MLILEKEQIQGLLEGIDLLPLMEEGFVAYSQGRVVVPPIGEMVFDEPPGDVHIKYGFLREDAYYVIKIASGFHENPTLGLPSGNGMMLLFDQRTGAPLAVLLDEGWLTEIRTAVAGAVAAKHLAPDPVTRIGMVGSGTQARLQLRWLEGITPCKQVMVLGKVPREVQAYAEDMTAAGYIVETTESAAELGAACNLIVTATPATRPILGPEQVQPGTHITAMGSDTPEKQELDCALVQKAERVVADSIEQCLIRGEISHALRGGFISKTGLTELGDVIAGAAPGRTSPEEITVADLTGVAVQDLQIAKAVFHAAGGTAPTYGD